MIKWIFFIFMVFGLIGCGSQNTGNSEQNKTPSPQSLKKVIKLSQEMIKIPQFKKVKFSTPAQCDNPIKVEVVLADDTVYDADLQQDYDFLYEWFVNKDIIPDQKEGQLPPDYFNAGDWIKCRAKLINKKNNQVLRSVSSNLINVSGFPPVLRSQPVTIPDIPGEFRYQILATDAAENYPNDSPIAENLKYQLLSPKEVGIKLNSSTGLITWNLTPKIIEDFNHRIEIKFKVENLFNASIEEVITLWFKTETRREEN